MSLVKKKGKAGGVRFFSKFTAAPVTLVVSLSAEFLKVGFARGPQGKLAIENVLVERIEKKNDAEIGQILYNY
ncbi:MAG: hypothetical protein KTQ49_07405, partial [Candidatus Omnitrophica bacterium]|nr:hypothetical protein [Candidatus Omnitrophota bacterium]